MLTRRSHNMLACTPESCATGATLPLTTEFDRLVRSVFGAMPVFAPLATPFDTDVPNPPVNMWEDDATIFVEAELPGFAEGDIGVAFEKGALTLSGKRSHSAEQKDERFIRRERTQTEFSRQIPIDAEIDADRIEASLTNGVLLISIPKSTTERARKIPVRSA